MEKGAPRTRYIFAQYLLPKHLFRSHTEYFLLWFYLNGKQGAFNAAAFSRQLHLGLKSRMCTMGYTGYQYGPVPYRAAYDDGKALWYRPYDNTRTMSSRTYSETQGKGVRRKIPFKLTARGENRAKEIYARVDAFLTGLTSDLTL